MSCEVKVKRGKKKATVKSGSYGNVENSTPMTGTNRVSNLIGNDTSYVSHEYARKSVNKYIHDWMLLILRKENISMNEEELVSFSAEFEDAIWVIVQNKWLELNGVEGNWNSLDFRKNYVNELISNMQNWNPCGSFQNRHGFEKWRNGEISIHDFIMQTPQEKFPERWTQLHAMKKAEEQHLYAKPEKGSTLYQCRQCHARNTSSTSVQTRSADEPMTIFIHCLNCGFDWRI